MKSIKRSGLIGMFFLGRKSRLLLNIFVSLIVSGRKVYAAL